MLNKGLPSWETCTLLSKDSPILESTTLLRKDPNFWDRHSAEQQPTHMREIHPSKQRLPCKPVGSDIITFLYKDPIW